MRKPSSTGDREAVRSLAERMAELFDDGVPAVIRGQGHIFGLEEVFEWVRRAHPPQREKTSLQKIRALKIVWGVCPPVEQDPQAADPGRAAELYRDGGLVLDATPFLPGDEDRDFAAWVAGTREKLGGDFGMQAPGLECADHRALQRLQALLAPTLERTGPRGYRYNAFLGDYRTTPFGYHLDPHHEAVFQFVLAGRRTGRFWEGLLLQDEDADWIEDSNGRCDPPRPPEDSFDLEPGDLVFWPGTHVHGFSCDGPSLALSIVIERTAPRARSEVAAGLKTASMGGHAALPAVASQEELELEAPLEFVSGYPIAFERYDDDLLIAVSGRLFEWPERASIPAAIQLFTRLNTLRAEQQSPTAGAVVDDCAGETLDAEAVTGTLSMLLAFGFFRQS